MLPLQGEIRRPSVVETPEIPIVRVVAVTTIAPEAAFVHIIALMAVHAFSRSIVEAPVLMTVFTTGNDVHTEERKIRHVMVKGEIPRPRFRTVAGLASIAKLTVVKIALAVALGAFPGKRFLAENPVVTVGAGKRSMGALESKIGIALVIEDASVPGSGRMAFLAFLAKAPIVIVLFGMTAKTVRVEILRGADCLGQMAIVAANLLMLANQREVGPLLVVKGSFFPRLGLMAVSAGAAQFPAVYVLGRMAILAFSGRVFVAVARVTESAIRRCMGAQEREIRFVVIELGCIPGSRFMTIPAFLAQLAIVAVIFPMTIDTKTRSLAIALVSLMAGSARGGAMGAFE